MYSSQALESLDLEFRKIHELTLLLKIYLEKVPSFERGRKECEFLNPH